MVFVMSGETEVRNENIKKCTRRLGLRSFHFIKLEKRKILNFKRIATHIYTADIVLII